ncbi:hypothetical protein NDU88_003944, partial [Pleurodeles waltl]
VPWCSRDGLVRFGGRGLVHPALMVPGFPKTKKEKGTGFLGVPGTAWSGSEGEVLFTRLSWSQDFPKQRRRKEQGDQEKCEDFKFWFLDRSERVCVPE